MTDAQIRSSDAAADELFDKYTLPKIALTVILAASLFHPDCIHEDMGEQPCHREFCPVCQREVAVVEGACPDCGHEFPEE
jgi:hypothetical protein